MYAMKPDQLQLGFLKVLSGAPISLQTEEYGISYTQGLAAGWIGWILQTAISLVLGLVSLAVTPLHERRDSAIKQEKND